MLLRRVARPLFASWFVAEGLDALRHPATHAASARLGLASLRERAARHPNLVGAGDALELPLTDRQLALVVQAHGAATVAAAGLLAVGKAPRTAGLALAVLTVPLVVAAAPAGKASSDEAEAARRRRFWSSLSALGGALLAAGDLEGRPGVAWRVHAAREARAATDQP